MLGNIEKIVTQRLYKRNTSKVHRLTFTVPTESTVPFKLSQKVIHSLVITGVGLGNQLRSPVMCREQPESINQKPSMPPTWKIKNKSESEQSTQHWG
jgi:hypothetical protein